MEFIQARHYTVGRHGDTIELLVVHDMEAPEARDTAENVCRWFAGPTAPQASAHYCIDIDSVAQGVRDEDMAWHAPGANTNGIGLEHAGYARQSALEWGDPYSEQMLVVSAGLAADLCTRHRLPVRFVDVAGLKRGERGITTHVAVSQAFKRSDHHDPGPNFPMEHYLALIVWKLGGFGPVPPKEDEDLTSDEVRLMFAYLEDQKNRSVEIINRQKNQDLYLEDAKRKLAEIAAKS